MLQHPPMNHADIPRVFILTRETKQDFAFYMHNLGTLSVLWYHPSPAHFIAWRWHIDFRVVVRLLSRNDVWGMTCMAPPLVFLSKMVERQPRILPCSQELYHERPARGCYMCFLLGKFIYVCVHVCGCSHVLHHFVNSYKLYDSSPLSKYSFLCRSRSFCSSPFVLDTMRSNTQDKWCQYIFYTKYSL